MPALATSGEANSTPPAGLESELRADLAARLSAPNSSISVVSLTPMTWPDSCLGLGKAGTVCAQALVPGWLAILEGPGGLQYRYRVGGGRVLAEE